MLVHIQAGGRGPMPFWYFFPVPKLPPDVSHQSNSVEIKKYLLAEGKPVKVGTPVALVENYWAVMVLKANGKGFLKKTFFDRGACVNVGDPIAIIAADGEDLPYGKQCALLDVTEHKKLKPGRKNPGS